MKTIPKTKHSNKFIKEKNQLIAKAVLDKKLDTVVADMSKIDTVDSKEVDHIQELLSNIKQQQGQMNETMASIEKKQEEINFRSITLEEYQKNYGQKNKSWFSRIFNKHK